MALMMVCLHNSARMGAVAFALLCSVLAQAGGLMAIDGDWQQGAMVKGRVVPGSSVVFAGRSLRVANDGSFVLGLGRDQAPKAVLTVKTPDGAVDKLSFDVKQRDYRIQRVTGVPQKTVTPDPEQIARARKEAEMAWRARASDFPREDYQTAFIWPVTGPISGVYGSQRVYNGKPGTPHYGVDIAQPTGTIVVAPASGAVTLVHDDMFYSGGTLIIDHGHGISSTFIHLSKILVKEGEEVKQGQKIALVGASGRATGPHLDWRMNWFNVRLDPQLVVGPMPQP